MQLGQAIAQIRKERGLTQEAFAKMYNVTRQTVSNWENEKSYPDSVSYTHLDVYKRQKHGGHITDVDGNIKAFPDY